MIDARIGHTTLTELRLRQADLEAQAQRLRDRAEGMDPTRSACAAVCRRVRAVQARADEYTWLLRSLDAPTLDDMEADVITVLTAPGGGEVATLALEPGLTRAQSLMGSLFEHWRNKR